jgi:ABC-2 type transport system ATP-binding protein
MHTDPGLAARPLDGALLLGVLPVLLLVLGVVGYGLVHLVRAPGAPYLPKWLWALVMLAVMPWGAVAYLVFARGTGTATSTAIASIQIDETPLRAIEPGRVLVQTWGLTRDYGDGAGLFDVDLAVPEGTVYGLVGPNGAGKTTLLSILTGLRRADRGTVTLNLDGSRSAVCPDVPEFEPWLTAYEVVDLSRHYVAPGLGAEDVWNTLHRTGLAEYAHRRVGGFSRGMTQRLGLAAALIGDPRLLILDEPTSALDPAGRAEILDLVAAMRGRRTVIFSSHILADVQRVADHVGVLRGGRLLYQGDTRALIDEHLDPRWEIRVNSPLEPLVRKLSSQPWVRRVERLDDGRLRVDADTLAHGEAGIPEILASCHARLVSCEPLAADLEAAFLALTREGERP